MYAKYEILSIRNANIISTNRNVVIKMTPEQCKMARAAKSLGVRELGKLSGISFTTINRFEKTGNANVNTVNKLVKALEVAGVVFLPDGINVNGGPGVRLREPN